MNDSPVASDVPPQIINQRTMVPLRFVAQALQAKVEWRDSDRSVIVTSKGKSSAAVPPGSGELRVVVDGREVRGDVPPVIVDGRTLVPVRFVAEAMSAKVGWDGENRRVLIKTTAQETPAPQQPPANTGASVQWDEWTVRGTANDARQQGDSPWTAGSDTLSYTGTGTHSYHNDFVVTRGDFDVSDILVTFEATGTFRTDYGYTGPVIAFTRPENVQSNVNSAGTIGVGGWYSWEPGKQDRGLLLFNYTGHQFYTEKFVDYGDSAYRSYTMRIKDGKLTLSTPEGTTYSADVPDAKPGLRLNLIIAMRQYDQGKTYSVSIRNLKITERPQ